MLPRPEAYAPLFTDLLTRLGVPHRLHPSLPLRFGPRGALAAAALPLPRPRAAVGDGVPDVRAGPLRGAPRQRRSGATRELGPDQPRRRHRVGLQPLDEWGCAPAREAEREAAERTRPATGANGGCETRRTRTRCCRSVELLNATLDELGGRGPLDRVGRDAAHGARPVARPGARPRGGARRHRRPRRPRWGRRARSVERGRAGDRGPLRMGASAARAARGRRCPRGRPRRDGRPAVPRGGDSRPRRRRLPGCLPAGSLPPRRRAPGAPVQDLGNPVARHPEGGSPPAPEAPFRTATSLFRRVSSSLPASLPSSTSSRNPLLPPLQPPRPASRRSPFARTCPVSRSRRTPHHPGPPARGAPALPPRRLPGDRAPDPLLPAGRPAHRPRAPAVALLRRGRGGARGPAAGGSRARAAGGRGRSRRSCRSSARARRARERDRVRVLRGGDDAARRSRRAPPSSSRRASRQARWSARLTRLRRLRRSAARELWPDARSRSRERHASRRAGSRTYADCGFQYLLQTRAAPGARARARGAHGGSSRSSAATCSTTWPSASCASGATGASCPSRDAPALASRLREMADEALHGPRRGQPAALHAALGARARALPRDRARGSRAEAAARPRVDAGALRGRLRPPQARRAAASRTDPEPLDDRARRRPHAARRRARSTASTRARTGRSSLRDYKTGRAPRRTTAASSAAAGSSRSPSTSWPRRSSSRASRWSRPSSTTSTAAGRWPSIPSA